MDAVKILKYSLDYFRGPSQYLSMSLTIKDHTVIHHTFVTERSYQASPERVFAALSDPGKKRLWYAAGDHHDVEKFEMDFRVGGTERSVYRFREGTPFPGVLLSNEGSFLDIEAGRRVVVASAMSLGGRRISASLCTFELLPTDVGTDLVLTHQGAFFEGSDGPEIREAGWRTLLDRLGAELGRE